jgi:hypothetical protein
MTTLVAFVSIDSHGATAFYLASDSRITWNPHERWDAGRKVFASRVHPDAFGYCGDVVFPSLVLSQILEILDTGMLFTDAQLPDERHSKVVSAIKMSFSLRKNAPASNFDIIHASREGSSNHSHFNLWQLSYEAKSATWTDSKVNVGTQNSSLIVALGSGATVISHHQKNWQSSEQGQTSRAVYSAFCDALASGDDIRSGGAPQLAGIYRRGPAKMIGTVHQRIRYFCGLPVSADILSDQLEWRDELFQRIDGESLEVIKGAKRHSRPKSLRS